MQTSVSGINTSFSHLNGENQKQAGASLTIYPLGNLNLYTNTMYVNHSQNSESNNIIEQMIGFKVSNKMWIEGFITSGNLYNYCEKNAFIVYNMEDKIKSRWGVSLLFPLNDKFGIDAMDYSKSLVKNRWKKVLGYSLLFWVLAFIVSGILSIPLLYLPNNVILMVILSTIIDFAVSFFLVATAVFFLKCEKIKV